MYMCINLQWKYIWGEEEKLASVFSPRCRLIMKTIKVKDIFRENNCVSPKFYHGSIFTPHFHSVLSINISIFACTQFGSFSVLLLGLCNDHF